MGELDVQNHSAAYYEKRYSGWGLRYHKSVIEWMMEGVFSGRHILDVGCGNGIIGRMYPNNYVTGVDISTEMIARCPQHPTHIYYVGSATEPHGFGWPHKAMDVVICRSLLHHLPDHKQALREIYKAMKPGATLITWDPNQSWLAEKVRERTQHGDRFSEYHRSFAPGKLAKDLQEAGFVIDEVRYMGFVGYPLFGFPDIIDIAKWIPFKPVIYRACMALDLMLEKIPFVNRISFAVGIKCHKN